MSDANYPALSSALGRLVAARRCELVYVCYAEYANFPPKWPSRMLWRKGKLRRFGDLRRAKR